MWTIYDRTLNHYIPQDQYQVSCEHRLDCFAPCPSSTHIKS